MLQPPLPAPLIRQRPESPTLTGHLLEQGVAPWLAPLIACRIESPITAEALFNPTLAHLADPSAIPDMARASERVVAAIQNGERVIFAVDHDMDGTASAAVLWTAFVDHFGVDPARLEVITSHRLTEGYGITDPVVERILASPATLIISADKGSSDEPRIARIAAAGRDLIVTDHHAIPTEGIPRSAYAVVNPTRSDSGYDPYICGAAVAFLLMAKVRTQLLAVGYRREIASLAQLIDLVAVATIADCVALRPDKSYANRALVKRGLALINQLQRPCWRVFKGEREGVIGSESIAFHLAPPIAAAGRLDWAEAGFLFLTAASDAAAQEQWQILQAENQQRKAIEAELRQRAFAAAQAEPESPALVFYFEDGHSGVHGITASRVVEAFGKPAALFARKGSGARDLDKDHPTLPRGESLPQQPLASGSFRAPAGFHVRNALQAVADQHPDLLVSFGGHAGAAGATIAVADFDRFVTAFHQAARAQQATHHARPELWVDGDLPTAQLNLETLDQLLALEPWGKDFPLPLFSGRFTVRSVKSMGDGTHLRLELVRDHQIFAAVWFSGRRSREDPFPLQNGEVVDLLYRLSDNWYRGRRSLQLMLSGRLPPR